MKIGFLYYDFFPVSGGASVHGYYLAKELSLLGHKLYKINGERDPYSIKLKNKLFGILKILFICDLIYLRLDYFLKLRNLSLLVALLMRKKIVVELNSPSDELFLFGKKMSYIEQLDKLAGYFLRKTDAVIVVSKAIKRYSLESLGLDEDKIYIVENGGLKFDKESEEEFGPVSTDVQTRVREIRTNYKKIAVWAGSLNKMQNLGILKLISQDKVPDTAVIAVVNESSCYLADLKAENLFLFRNVSRADVMYIIRSSDVGLAFYGQYDWCRWGFYNSSLKIFEFLNNGLLTISNKEGSEIQSEYPNFKVVRNDSEVFSLLNDNLPEFGYYKKMRTWKDVAIDVEKIMNKVLQA